MEEKKKHPNQISLNNWPLSDASYGFIVAKEPEPFNHVKFLLWLDKLSEKEFLRVTNHLEKIKGTIPNEEE